MNVGSKEWRDMVGKHADGRRIKTLRWSAAGYWVLTFEDGSEICFNLTMAEVSAGVGRK